MNSFKNILLVLFISFFILSFINSNSVFALDANGYFNKDLSIGDDNNDVKYLQQFLNRDSDTALIGSFRSNDGTLGYETTYFGSRTESAVTRFQNKYAEEILYPVNLSYGTGYFGSSSRAKANQMLAQYFSQNDDSTANDDSTEVQQQESTAASDPVLQREVFDPETDSFISYVKGYNWDNPGVFRLGRFGSNSYSVIGFGFKESTRAYLLQGLDKKEIGFDVVNEGYAYINIPNDTAPGKYDLVIDNDGILSEPYVVHIQKNTAGRFIRNWEYVEIPPPTIKSISNQPIVYGDTVTIEGNNFDDGVGLTEVRTPLSTYFVEPESNSKIVLTFDKPDYLENRDVNEPFFESFVVVSNRNGISKKHSADFGDKSEGILEEDSQEQRNSAPSSDSGFEDTVGNLVKDGVGKLTRTAINSMTSRLNSFFSGSGAGAGGGANINPFTYGGKLTSYIACPCSSNLLMYIYDYKTNSILPLLYQPGVSKLLTGAPTGFNQLGSYAPYGYCLIPSFSGCFSIPSRGIAGGLTPGYGTAF